MNSDGVDGLRELAENVAMKKLLFEEDTHEGQTLRVVGEDATSPALELAHLRQKPKKNAATSDASSGVDFLALLDAKEPPSRPSSSRAPSSTLPSRGPTSSGVSPELVAGIDDLMRELGLQRGYFP